MPTENQDRNAIVSKAIGIASEEDRAAYISQACNDNAELKHQVEEQVAEHFRDNGPSSSQETEQSGEKRTENGGEAKTSEGSAKKRADFQEEVRAVAQERPRFMIAAHFGDEASSPQQESEQSGEKQDQDGGEAKDSEQSQEKHGEDGEEAKDSEQSGEKRAGYREEVRAVAHEHPRLTTMSAILLLLLSVSAAGGVSLAIWEWHKGKQAQKAEQQAAEKQKKAEKEAETAKGKLKRADAEAKERVRERDEAEKAERKAKNAEEELRLVQSFIKNKLLSVARPGDVSLSEAFWAGTRGKDATARVGITLRQAVDEAEEKVAEAFVDRPRAEATVREMLGLAYLNLGEAEKAVQQYEQAFELRESRQGDSAWETADCRNNLAVAYRLAGRHADASRLFHRYPNSPAHASTLVVRGLTLLALKKPVEAERKLRESLTIRQKTQPDKWTTFETKSILGQALADQKKYDKAEPLLLSGYQGMKKRASQIQVRDKGQLALALERLVNCYEAWGKKDKAAEWRKELEKAMSGKKS